MTLLYVKEHTGCYNYESSSSPIAERKLFVADDKWCFTTMKHELIYVREGAYQFAYGQYKKQVIMSGQAVLIPAGTSVVGEILEPTTVYVLRLRETKNLCECFSLDMLLREEDNAVEDTSLFFLPVHDNIVSFFSLWDQFIQDGLLCRYYLNLKIKELFYLLRAYHTKPDLLDFFNPLLSNDMTFSDFVSKNHSKVRTVNELAELANYSLSGFQKRFKKVFGVSAYNWMKEEKLKTIFHEINNSPKTFKEISLEHGFSSPSHFNDFCKANFGYTPGILRKNKINLRILKE